MRSKTNVVLVLDDEEQELNDLTASMLSLSTEENRFKLINTNNDDESELGDIDDQNAKEPLDFGGRSTSRFLREKLLKKRKTDIEDDNDTSEETSDLEIEEVAPKARKFYKAKKVNSKASDDHTDSLSNEDEEEIPEIAAQLPNGENTSTLRIPSTTTTVESTTPFSPVNYNQQQNNSIEDERPVKKVYLKHPTLFLGDMSGKGAFFFNSYHDDGDNTI